MSQTNDRNSSRRDRNDRNGSGNHSEGKMIWLEVAEGKLAFLVKPELAETAAWLLAGWNSGHVPAEPAPHAKEMIKVVLLGEKEIRMENTPAVLLRFALGTEHFVGTQSFSAFITEDGKFLQLVQGKKVLKSYERGKRVNLKEDWHLVEALATVARLSQKDIDAMLGRNKPSRIFFNDMNVTDDMTLTGQAVCNGATRYDVHIVTDVEKKVRGELVASAPADAKGIAKLSWTCTFEQPYMITAFSRDGEIATLMRTPRKERSQPQTQVTDLSYVLVSDNPLLVAHMGATCKGATHWTVRTADEGTPFVVATGTGEKAEAFFQVKYGTVFDVEFTMPDGKTVKSDICIFEDKQGREDPVTPMVGCGVAATLNGNITGTGFCHGAMAWIVYPQGDEKGFVARDAGPLAQFAFDGKPGQYTLAFATKGKKWDQSVDFTIVAQNA